jgi:5-methylcytosine-specific restriction endonuclease McrA
MTMRERRCPGCRKLVARVSDDFRAEGVTRGSRRSYDRVPATNPTTAAEIVALIEVRWGTIRTERAWRAADLAVGLRFAVFTRDGFRCRYCGRNPSDGARLEADHVVPRVDGGSDSLSNLVTACEMCNRGKSARTLTAVVPPAHTPVN